MRNAKPESLLRAELLIGNALRCGVLLCLFVLGLGLTLRLRDSGGNAGLIGALTSGQAPAGYQPPTSPAALIAGSLSLSPDTVIALGLVMLIALPIARVALTTLIFLVERDWAFFAITLLVLAVLLSGILLGRAL